jgi:glycosyltransferase involved in cell wall biosynthesis
LAAATKARQLAHRYRVDLVWHLTYANIWIGSIGGLLGKPFVLGPVGGGVGPPWRLLPEFGWRGAVHELVRSVARTSGRWLNPLSRTAWTRAGLILVQNPETRGWLPRSVRSKVHLFDNVAFETDLPFRTHRTDGIDQPVALFAGRLVAWKGVALAVRTLTLLPDWRLVLLGSGPDEARLRGLAAELAVADRVEFRGWLDRSEVLRAMSKEADVFIFPSLHEEGGWAVSEALAVGLPVVCLDRGGPPLVVGRGVPIAGEAETLRRLARELVRTLHETRPTRTVPTVERRRQELVALLSESRIASVGFLWGANSAPNNE